MRFAAAAWVKYATWQYLGAATRIFTQSELPSSRLVSGPDDSPHWLKASLPRHHGAEGKPMTIEWGQAPEAMTCTGCTRSARRSPCSTLRAAETAIESWRPDAT